MVNESKWYHRFLPNRKASDASTSDSSPYIGTDVKAPDPDVIIVHTQDIGSLGSRNYSGYAQEEYLSQLTGQQRADIFDQMRRSDPQISMVLQAVKNPIIGANWELQPGDDSDEAKQDCELMEQILFNDMDRPFNEFLSEALTFLDFGFSVFEITDKPVIDHPKFGSYNGIRSLAFRSQRTIERWNLDHDSGLLISIAQYAYGDIGRVVDIPAEFLLVFTHRKEGANYEGISALRPVYGPWFRKDRYLKLNAIGIEKFAVPTIIAEIPEGAQNTKQYENLKEVLKSYANNNQQYITYPAGWKIEVKSNSYDPEKSEASINAEDVRIAKAFLASFLELGLNGGGGAYALSSDLSEFMLEGLDHYAAIIEGQINQKLIPRMIRLNRGKRPVYPKLVHSGISDKAGKELSEILKFLADAQIIIPDDQLEESVRKRYRLPALSLEGQRAVKPVGALGVGDPGQAPQGIGKLSERIMLAHMARRGRL